MILIVPGALWYTLGAGSTSSLTRLAPALTLVLVGIFILGAGTLVTLEEMLRGTAAPPPPAPAAPPQP